ncbi:MULTISPECIES: YbaB/EbfC family nucleoid-associated protein [Rhizobium/Agrobacterium group]|jgi:DNA-binding YbaB/EbfC family protein|uniref:Nucleoid-associated protein G6L72_00090 n=2 Tax=Agrobacterium rubi TaxID=28099 RepID=A0AAE7UPA5_9HYPH|nr:MULTISPECIES: YbaB/EbfC family nucleoid-associated protein [Rhizobium/Agrobacterium group]KQO77090.1 nucleoid-associated protein [Rhizobium sp. Leaf262]MBP1879507.1 DNA-binding YbaB/EbfC family protein [Agrobacterium rubi]MCL6653287.1 nucleoid-associated protein [Agrobacterium rubi]NTE84992.1 YbaB/EbfC family nucleoid-associated protein [Agrobacterium rubi]NTF00924.1 YbaB/EbfC family nucleoid-associated protein [Agrobacterium rubi]
MRDIMGMMGKVKEMQAKMEKMQEEIAALEVEGTSGGGLVTVKMSGKGSLLGVKIDPSLLKEDEIEILEDLLVAAHNDAKQRAEAVTAEKTRDLTAGLPIPPGMKLPF